MLEGRAGLPALPGRASRMPSPSNPTSSTHHLAASTAINAASSAAPEPSPDFPGTARHFATQRRMLLFLLVGTVLLPAVLLAGWAWLSLDAMTKDAGRQATRLARVVQEHASKIFEANYQINSRVRDAFATMSNAQLSQQERDMHARLMEIGNGLPQASSLSVFGANGMLLASSRFFPVSRVSIADREDFRAIMQERQSLHISQVMQGRVLGDPIFNFSLPRLGPEGNLAGIVAVSLRPAYFSAFYRELLSEDPGFSAALLLRDGSVLASYPATALTEDASDGAAGGDGPGKTSRAGTGEAARAPAGAADGAAQDARRKSLATVLEREDSGAVTATGLDGRAGLIAHRPVGGSALQAMVSVPWNAIHARWREQLYIAAAVLAVPSFAMWALVGMSLQRLRREQAAWHKWQDEAARRREAEDNYRQARKLEVVGRLIASVAHDFRNVLSVISFNADVLALRHGREASGRGAAGEDPFASRVERAREQALQGIRKGVGTGTALAGQLLGMARKREHRREWILLPQQLAGWTPLIQSTLGSRIRLRYRIDASCRRICADRVELELALVNLAANARDAMPQGGLFELSASNTELEIERQPSARGDASSSPGRPVSGHYVCISARDTGSGMTEAVRLRAFEPLYTTKEPGLGTGLGLSQVLEFCRESDGAAAIESAPGRGTTVRLFLPAQDAAHEDAQGEGSPGKRTDELAPLASTAGNAVGASNASAAPNASNASSPSGEANVSNAINAATARVVPTAPNAPAVSEPVATFPPQPALSILLVTNNMQGMKSSLKSLLDSGHRVQLTDSEADALELVDSTGFDLVLSDARLGGAALRSASASRGGPSGHNESEDTDGPQTLLGAAAGFGGLALLQRLAWRYPFLPVVLMTDENDVLTLSTLTGRRFLLKPWHAQTLRRAGVLSLALTGSRSPGTAS